MGDGRSLVWAGRTSPDALRGPFVPSLYNPHGSCGFPEKEGDSRLCRMGRPFFRKGRRWARTGPASTLLIEDVPGKGCLGLFLPGRKSPSGFFEK